MVKKASGSDGGGDEILDDSTGHLDGCPPACSEIEYSGVHLPGNVEERPWCTSKGQPGWRNQMRYQVFEPFVDTFAKRPGSSRSASVDRVAECRGCAELELGPRPDSPRLRASDSHERRELDADLQFVDGRSLSDEAHTNRSNSDGPCKRLGCQRRAEGRGNATGTQAVPITQAQEHLTITQAALLYERVAAA